jgi:hypothetical protein
MLKKSAYRGIAYFGKMEPCEPFSTCLPEHRVRINGRCQPKRSFRLRDRKDWIEKPVPSIIDNDTFEVAQELMRTNKSRSIRNAKPVSLLQGVNYIEDVYLMMEQCQFDPLTLAICQNNETKREISLRPL